jgi:hypothetical protein
MSTNVSELEVLFQQELKLQDEELRRSAALATLHQLRLNNRVTVEQFLIDLQKHKDLWTVASQMGIRDLAAILGGGGSHDGGTHSGGRRATEKRPRTRLSNDTKAALKLAVVRVLSSHTDGLSRPLCAKAIAEQGLIPASVDPADLADKLRQPLVELVAEGRLHTVGEKRLMRYLAGSNPKKK